MLAEDSQAAAVAAAIELGVTSGHQFFDSGLLASRAIAESIGASGELAWDMYIGYAAGSMWDKEPPTPVDWVHQLPYEWADPGRMACGDDLAPGIARVLDQLR